MFKPKTRSKLKRTLSGFIALTMSMNMSSIMPVIADDEINAYPYTLFAGRCEEGAITSTASNFCVNGSIATNGTISVGGNFKVNGIKKEHAEEDMPIIFDSIDDTFFSGETELYSEDYTYSEMNINGTVPIEVRGDLELDGNIR